MVAVQPIEPIQMTEAEYLAFEETSEIKHEFRQGEVCALADLNIRHNIITVNVGTQLHTQLEDTDSIVTMSQNRVYVARTRSYRYPDVIVFCGDPDFYQGRDDTIKNPSVAVEVISPSTELRDRNEKLEEYLQLESLHAYLLVSQDAPKVERFLHHKTNDWLYSFVTGLEGDITLPELGCTLELSKLYQKVTFDPANDDEDASKTE